MLLILTALAAVPPGLVWSFVPGLASRGCGINARSRPRLKHHTACVNVRHKGFPVSHPVETPPRGDGPLALPRPEPGAPLLAGTSETMNHRSPRVSPCHSET